MDAASMAAAVFKAAPLAILCAGCSSIHATPATFEGTRWQARAINGLSLAGGERLILDFGPYYSSAIGACNNKQSHYRILRRTIVFEGGMTTERGCRDKLMAFDARAFALLAGPMRMKWRSGNRLALSNSGGSIELELLR